jgi:dTMP kinase
LFITFEGIEGCGKTTQIRRLEKRLAGRGIPLVATLEPGGTRVGNHIRHILLDARNRDLASLAELLLYAADRAQHLEEVIRPALNQGKWVLCDRFTDATVAYQGRARGQDMKLVRYLNETATRGIRPDMTFLLDCPVEIGLGRALKRNQEEPGEGQDRFEREKTAFHHEVRRAYLEIARKDRGRVIIIEADAAEDDVEERIFEHIRPLLGG